jgi:hypothetical protein
MGEKIGRISHGTKREAMIKDLPFILAAKATDGRLVSLDEAARALFMGASVRMGELRNIAWLNPSKPEERIVDWLERDAPLEESRTLGHTSGKH